MGLRPKKSKMSKYDFTAVLIVPTGVGASIGGYAGDASSVVNLISKVCPVITNPNTVNAAAFSGINENILYTEGFAIDSFFKREIALRPPKHNKIGVIFDKSIPKPVLNVHINTMNAVKTVYGIDTSDWIQTEKEVGVEFSISDSGISTGNIKNPDTLINAAKSLVDKGSEALAVVCYFEEPEDTEYSQGIGVDPVGGVEAVISHILTREFKIPVAHAPAFGESCLKIQTEIVDPRAAAEYITPTFLPCILLGLHNAPKLIDIKEANQDDITLNSIKALIMPYNCLGSIPVLKAIENNIPVLAVKENKTILHITAKSLNIENKVIEVKNYSEAVEYLHTLKEYISKQ
ncbi:MAG: hypothetical protein ACD_20C00357G0012 [uncultured bacterium]|nr:MAG: hypothetical protein ACD_20C00357G0012 [uncultured bacterium]HBH17356.1 hypothetical protein [Cyanobacteria bacterium UBA9579]